jgi:hypothetical protein
MGSECPRAATQASAVPHAPPPATPIFLPVSVFSDMLSARSYGKHQIRRNLASLVGQPVQVQDLRMLSRAMNILLIIHNF